MQTETTASSSNENLEAADIDAAIKDQAAKIRALLPQLVQLSAALGELYEMFVDGEIEGDFDDFCYRQFHLNPDLVREAADTASQHRELVTKVSSNPNQTGRPPRRVNGAAALANHNKSQP